MFKKKKCKACDTIIQPTAPGHLYCSECKEKAVNRDRERRRQRSANRHADKCIREGRPEAIGCGKGGSQGSGTANSNYKNGTGIFINKLRDEVKNESRYCKFCKKDLLKADRWSWCVHHVDHDRNHNVKSNLILLCKRCHQIEHKCWEAFTASTTIPKGSTPKQGEAPSSSNEDDDIV